MTSRERVKRTLTFTHPDRVPRDIWTLPIALNKYKKEINVIFKRFPIDIGGAEYNPPYPIGDIYEIGTYIDEWGCVFKNIQRGVIGEVKNPIVKNLSDIDKVKPPYKFLGKGMEKVNKNCRKSDKFILAGLVNTFERMQFLRGTSNLFVDIMDQPPEFSELREIVHKYHLKVIETWVETEVDGIILADDWGAQNSLLIRPNLWRELFKPLYKEYCDLIHSGGKFVFMHSDGYIFDIYGDLIEIGIDAINSQLFCMNIEEIGRKFKGKITFWGEIDRQHILTSQDLEEVRRAVKRVKNNLYDERGGVVAQCEFGPGAKPENVETVFEEWARF